MLHELVHILCLFLAISVPVLALNSTLFSWHPTLMALGFFGLMAEGVLTSISFRCCPAAVLAGDAGQLLTGAWIFAQAGRGWQAGAEDPGASP